MNKTAVIRARIEPQVKKRAEKVLRRLGVSTTQAITMFYKQVALRQGLLFDVAMPPEITRKTP
jgi:DNA-damage-inducible protein J